MEMYSNEVTKGLVSEPDLPIWESAKKRKFPEDFKRRAVAYYESLPEDGSRGAYLRRSGINSSLMSNWRSGIRSGTITNLGRKPIDPVIRENAELKVRLTKLEAELLRANTVIEVQKKVSALLESLSETTS